MLENWLFSERHDCYTIVACFCYVLLAKPVYSLVVRAAPIRRLMTCPSDTGREREAVGLKNKWHTLVILLAFLTIILVVWLRHPGFGVGNVSAVETSSSLGAYWDVGCSAMVSSIDWGNLTPSQTRNITFYIRNEGSTTLFLSGIDKNWNPITAEGYIRFVFGSADQVVQASEVKKVTCSLTISPEIINITNFSFDVLLQGTNYLLADVNQDGIVDMKDIAIVGHAFGTTPTSSDWNPNADLNRDLEVDMHDLSLVCQDYAKTSQ